MFRVARSGGKLLLGGSAAGAWWSCQPQAASPSLPPFSAEKPKYDLSTFAGRFQSTLEVIDPRYLTTTQAQVDEARKKIEAWKKGSKEYSDEELWNARLLIEVTTHPVTQEMTFAPGRMSAFVPLNVPIVTGMLVCSNSPKLQVFWQWVNQTYNCVCNYTNRSGATVDTEKLLKAYGLAVGVSCSMALVLSTLVSKSKALQKFGVAVPYCAVVMAGSTNIYFTRQEEIDNGAPVMDRDGTVLGNSKNAGFLAVKQTIMTRQVGLPVVPLLFPPLAMSVVSKVVTARPLQIMFETFFVTCAFCVGLPCALAILPQEQVIPVSQLEPEFQGLKLKDGSPVTEVLFNKGL